MFEVDVKNVMEKGRQGPPAWVWGSDRICVIKIGMRFVFGLLGI